MHTTTEQRISTFEGRTDVLPIDIKKLAEAGFCWTPFKSSPRAVRCEVCEVILKDISPQTDPIVAHKRACPDCPFIKTVMTVKLPGAIQAPAPNSAKASVTIRGPEAAKTPDAIKFIRYLDTTKPPKITETPKAQHLGHKSLNVSKAPQLIKALGAVKPAIAVVQAPYTGENDPANAMLIDVGNSEQVDPPFVELPILASAKGTSPPSGAIGDLMELFNGMQNKDAALPMGIFEDPMEVFAAMPSKGEPVNSIIGTLTNRNIQAEPGIIAEKGPYSATTRPIPDDLRTCQRCKAILEDRDQLFRHVFTDCGNNPDACPNPYPCRVCRASFDTKKLLKKHLQSVHNISLWF
ncbi:hypothetical protein F5X68DRAFT_246730 [Plectosphaerella plurivora]|uniref:C2H2-type domain-containing protein n=1 Tax=Plectosphaerella plurivora TaxID=936078 RepID=A0A9P8V282_9PEZI|nr:hypothetical protein F5X68DRAFT_246730 [Plectosphaerella plurivora]